jgi:hypothetical protein
VLLLVRVVYVCVCVCVRACVCADWRRKYAVERATRRALHNELQELRGNIRVFCRIRAVAEDDPVFGRMTADRVRSRRRASRTGRQPLPALTVHVYACK